MGKKIAILFFIEKFIHGRKASAVDVGKFHDFSFVAFVFRQNQGHVAEFSECLAAISTWINPIFQVSRKK